MPKAEAPAAFKNPFPSSLARQGPRISSNDIAFIKRSHRQRAKLYTKSTAPKPDIPDAVYDVFKAMSKKELEEILYNANLVDRFNTAQRAKDMFSGLGFGDADEYVGLPGITMTPHEERFFMYCMIENSCRELKHFAKE